jgi:phage terminase large subunit-like protein
LDIDNTIGAFLRELYKNYRLDKILYDPYQLHDLSTRLRSDGLPMVEYPQSVPNLTAMGQNLYDLIKFENLVLYPDDFMRTCASHAIAIQSSRGWRIAKEKTSNKIDVIVALAMASWAAVEKPAFQGWSRGMQS